MSKHMRSDSWCAKRKKPHSITGIPCGRCMKKRRGGYARGKS